MKIKNTKLSKRTLALLAATALLFSGGSYVGTRAALGFFSNELTAGFELNHLQVHLIENDEDVCHGNNENTVHRSDGENPTKKKKYRGNLLEEYLGYKNDSHNGDVPAYTLGTPGKVEPGWKYKEELRAKNGNNVDEYVRIIVRKYWAKEKKDADGNTVMVKATDLSPALIKLTANGKDYDVNDTEVFKKQWNAFNSDSWLLGESSAESATYYYKTQLEGGELTDTLFDTLTIDNSVASHANMTEDKKETTDADGNKLTVITYRYDYDGLTFYVEAEVQAIQTHNAAEAIKSMWGVNNVSAGNGTLTVH